MKEKVRFLGLDVRAETIAVAVAEPDGEVRSLGAIPNRVESIRKMIKKLGRADKLRACYEAGPTGYVVYWQLAELGIACEVVAPTLVPVKAGDRVKTDRRDAEKLARCYRSGDLTAVWVPDEGSEAALLYDMIYTQPIYYELDRITVPTVLFIGDKDNTAIGRDLAPPSVRALLGNYPKLGKEAATRIPGAKLIEFPDLGHSP